MTISLDPFPAGGMDGEPVAISPSVLPAAIRQHLASVLDQTYGPLDMDSATDRFAGLLTRLRAALTAQEERDARAFHDEFLSLVPNLRRFAISLTKDAARADDLVQDTMLKAWRSRTRFAADTNLGAWLFTIMRNVFYSDYRKSAREVPISPGDEAGRLISIPEQPGRLDLQDMTIALAKLPDVMRQALVLVAIENLSYEEAAIVMACKVGTVKSRVWRAREQIAILLGFDAHEFGADRVTMSVVNGTGLAAASLIRVPSVTSDMMPSEPPISYADIRARAYEIWDRNHRPEGCEISFWLMAERELRSERAGQDAVEGKDPVITGREGREA